MEYYHSYYKHTVKRKATQMWQDIKARLAGKTGRGLSYHNVQLLMKREDFITWVTPELEKWKMKFGSLLNASLDRIDNEGHYEIPNLQLLTKYENSIKRITNKNVTAPDGYAWCCYHKEYFNKKEFHKLKSSYNGLAKFCKSCASVKQKELRNKRKQENNIYV